MRRAQILTAILVTISVSACGPAESRPAAAPPATSAASRTASVAPASSATAGALTAGALAACKLAAKAPRSGEAIEIDEQAVKSIIENAGRSGVASIEQAGAQLQARYSAWLDAEIGDESANAQDAVLDAMGRVHRACLGAATTP